MSFKTQEADINTAAMLVSELEPSLPVKLNKAENRKVTNPRI